MSEEKINNEETLSSRNPCDKQMEENEQSYLKENNEVIKAEESAIRNGILNEKHKFHEDLKKLRSHFTSESDTIFSMLRSAYLDTEKYNKLTRRFIQLSMLGIIWSKLFEYTEFKQFKDSFGDPKLEFEIEKEADVWRTLKESHKESIVEWIEDFHFSHRPEFLKVAIISADLWGIVFRKLVYAIEASCSSSGHKQTGKMHCVSQYSSENIKSINQIFYTDLAILAGCEGIPLMLIETASDLKISIGVHEGTYEYDLIHEDLKKLAISMAGVLLHLVGAIQIQQQKNKKSSSNTEYFLNLRVFGALVQGTEVEFCVCRPYLDKESKITIIFETHQEIWSFDLFGTEIRFEPAPADLFEKRINSKSGISGQEVTPFDLIESINIEDRASMFKRVRQENKKKLYMVKPSDLRSDEKFNGAAMSSIAKFIKHCHSYYVSLPDEIADIYRNPDNYNHNLDLVYPSGICNLLQIYIGDSFRASDTFFDSEMRLTPCDAPLTYISPTLPAIKYIEPCSESLESFRFVQYREEKSMSEGVSLFEDPEDYYRNGGHEAKARLLLNILLAIYKAYQAGYVFSHFSSENITFRDLLFCIKSYKHVKKLTDASTGRQELAESLKSFLDFYSRCWFLEMNAGSVDYVAFDKLEDTIIRWMSSFGDTIMIDWEEFLSDILQKYKDLLYEIGSGTLFEITYVLLNNEVKLFKKNDKNSPS